MTSVAVIGGGHNGLVCACYLADAGLDVTVFEANQTAGGCIWTERLPSGHRIERGAIDHGPILSVAEELELGRFGLEYAFRDVTAGAAYGDGTRLLFHRDLDTTLEGFAGLEQRDVAGYRTLARVGSDLLAILDGLSAGPSVADVARLGPVGGIDPMRLILGSSEKIVGDHVGDRHLAAALTMYGSFAQLPPWLPGTGLFGLLLAGSHGHGPGRPIGGSEQLIEALAKSLEAAGGTLRTGDAVVSINGSRSGVALRTSATGDHRFDIVVSTLDIIRTSRLVSGLPALQGAARGATSGSLNVAEFKVDLALSAPATPGGYGPPEALWMLQPRPGAMTRSFGEIAAGLMPSEPSILWASPSALDPSGAPPGGGTAWMSTFVPARLRDGDWSEATLISTAERILDSFASITEDDVRDRVVDMRVTGPQAWERRTGAVSGNPNHIDMTLDQMFSLRPPTAQGYRTEAPWLYLSGAGTFPGGGLSGLPGKNAAMTVLGDLGRGRSGRSILAGLSAARRGWRVYRTLQHR